MSQPGAGFPDYQGSHLWRSPAWYDFSSVLTANQQVTQILLFTSPFAGFQVRISVTGIGARIRVAQDRGDGDANPLYTNRWHFRPGHTVNAVMPLVSTRLLLDSLAAGGGGTTISYKMQQVDTFTDKVHYLSEIQELATLDNVCGAGATVDHMPADLWPGPATLWLRGPSAGSTLTARIVTIDLAGALINILAQWPNFGGDAIHQIHIPHSLWFFRVINSGGAGQQYSFGITPRGSLT